MDSTAVILATSTGFGLELAKAFFRIMGELKSKPLPTKTNKAKGVKQK